MEQLLGDAKRLVQRLNHHDNSVDILVSEVTNIQNKLIAMRQYRDEVSKLNDIADHRPRSTLILGSQLENQRIQNLKEENQELSISLAEHQSALELIMNKYREQVLSMMQPNSFQIEVPKNTDQTIEMVFMKERIAEMARIMWQSAAIDDNAQIKEIEFVRKLQVENENLRELLEISGGKLPSRSPKKQTSPVNFEFKPVPLEGSPVQNHNSSDNSASFQSENTSSDGNARYFSGDVNNDDQNDVFNSFSMHKLKKRYGAKKNMFGNTPLPFELEKIENESDCMDSISDKESIRKLTQLFNPNHDEQDTPNPSPCPPSHSDTNGDYDKYFLPVDPSENCFRAIISDIKPMDFHVDMNEKLYDHDNTLQLEEDVTGGIDENVSGNDEHMSGNDGHLSGNDRHVSGNDEHISGNDEHETGSDEFLTKTAGNVVTMAENAPVPAENLTDTAKNVFEVDIVDDEFSFLEDSCDSSQTDDFSDVSEISVIECLDNFDSIIQDAEASASSNSCYDDDDDCITETINREDEVVDINSVKSDIHETPSDDEVKNRLQAAQLVSNGNGDELSVFGFLDDVLDNESELDENSEIDDGLEQRFLSGSNNIEKSVGDSAKNNIMIDFKSMLSANSNDDDILTSDCRTQNGEISDTESEVTYTEEDIDQALSDFDSVLDLNDDSDNDELD